jgi:hypothetical protein
VCVCVTRGAEVYVSCAYVCMCASVCLRVRYIHVQMSMFMYEYVYMHACFLRTCAFVAMYAREGVLPFVCAGMSVCKCLQLYACWRR